MHQESDVNNPLAAGACMDTHTYIHRVSRRFRPAPSGHFRGTMGWSHTVTGTIEASVRSHKQTLGRPHTQTPPISARRNPFRSHATLDAKSKTGRSTWYQLVLRVLFPNHRGALLEWCLPYSLSPSPSLATYHQPERRRKVHTQAEIL